VSDTTVLVGRCGCGRALDSNAPRLPKNLVVRRANCHAQFAVETRTAAATCDSFTRRGAFAGNERETIEGDAGFPSQEGSASVARLDAENHGVETKCEWALLIRVRRARADALRGTLAVSRVARSARG
jgi:hypothetical protein